MLFSKSFKNASNLFSKYRLKFIRLLDYYYKKYDYRADFFALAILEKSEFEVFKKMYSSDKMHGYIVAKKIFLYENPSNELLAAALLHDCGKMEFKYSFLHRVIIGLLPYKLAKFFDFKFVQMRFLHPKIGAEIILKSGGRNRVATLTLYHHDPICEEGFLLKKYDE